MRRFERELAKVLDCDQKTLMLKAEKLVSEAKELRRELDKMRKSDARGRIDAVKASARQIGGVSVIMSRTEGLSVDEMKKSQMNWSAMLPKEPGTAGYRRR